VDHRADSHADEYIGEDLFKGGDDLILRVDEAVALCERGRVNGRAARVFDEILDIALHVQLFDDRAADDRDDKAKDHVDDRDLRAEDAHQQHEAAEIDHRRGDEKRERHADGQARAREADEERDRRAGAERRHGAEQRRDGVGPDAVKAAEDLFAPLRGKIALDVADEENQQTQQNGDLEDIVQEKLQASAPAVRDVHAEKPQKRADQRVQPFHAENLILDKVPDHESTSVLKFICSSRSSARSRAS